MGLVQICERRFGPPVNLLRGLDGRQSVLGFAGVRREVDTFEAWGRRAECLVQI